MKSSLAHPIQIDLIDGSDSHVLNVIRALLREYEQSLNVKLCFQQFDAELAALPGDYAAPLGALFGARHPTGDWFGCVAVRAQSSDTAE